MTNALFVYGSLRSECDNPHVRKLRNEAKSMGRATVRGSIFRTGDFSGYKEEPAGIVQGELWQLNEPEKTLVALDEYEGDEYPRVVVRLEQPPVDAWIYVYAGHVAPDARIESGDFLAP